MRKKTPAFSATVVPPQPRRETTLSDAELRRVFAILRFIAQRPAPNDGSSSSNSGSGGDANDSQCADAANPGAVKAPSKKTANKPHIPESVAEPLEKFRMSVTNLSVQAEEIQQARVSLCTVLLQTYPNDAAEVEWLCGRDMFAEDPRAESLPGFMRNDVYALQAMHEILPGLYVGSYHPASDKANLQSHNITHVLCCINVTPRFPQDFEYMTLPADDAPGYNIAKFFPQTFDFVENALNKHSAILVHCGAGISRAPTITAAYLIRKLRITAAAAIAFIQRRRRVASPNTGFRQQLRTYQEKLDI
ncbi:dual specificity protein phosphatase [Trypanosoma grayi]|uniref:dual specificity protein phosphatase n=1 Tax=Trypanosoma grayi TaxID=71804 RepID=UPI0004F466C5|nr:dual specificity protein phosphatase [Trypanosoma grayi]KEG06352.1 dual specificity protein phosphatase [Trypanosoma grayi]